MHPDKIEYTYIDPSNRGFNSRIDFILTTKNVNNKVIFCEHKAAPVPDHKAVFMQIKYNGNPRGKGYWKLNTSILDDVEYINGIKDVLKDTIGEYGSALNVCHLWELLKIRFKEFSISFCKYKAAMKRNEMIAMEEKIQYLDNLIVQQPENLELVLERKAVKTKGRVARFIRMCP